MGEARVLQLTGLPASKLGKIKAALALVAWILMLGLVSGVYTPQKAQAWGPFDWLPGVGDDDDDDRPPRRGGGGWFPDERDSRDRSVTSSNNREFVPINVRRDQWEANDEVQFGYFVAQLGRAIKQKKCATVRDCFKNPAANMYASRDAYDAAFTSDCADFPYLLRAYFAHHNQLPFGHVTQLEKNSGPVASLNDKADEVQERRLDNSPYGNTIVSRGHSNVPSRSGDQINLWNYLTTMFDQVASSSFRVSPLSRNYHLSDVYPVKLNRSGIGPGALVHSTGHLLVVWDVDAKGVVHVIDAHPDGSVQYKEIQPSTLDRGRPDQALGFFRFRPMEVVGARQDWDGNFYGGKVRGMSDRELIQADLYSLEQWFGPESNYGPGASVDPNLWKQAFRRPGFFDYLASHLRRPGFEVQADEIVGDMLNSICNQFQLRVADVEAATKQSIQMRRHPEALPADIFGQVESEVWGPYSTPGRDGRLRGSVGDILKAAVTQYRLSQAPKSGVIFRGTVEDYVKALRNRLASVNKSCSVKYTKSNGTKVSLSLNQLLSRLNKISLDPYHCPEKRWGASGTEMQSCRDGDSGGQWYEAEQVIRNTVGKTDANEAYVVRSQTPITLAMLRDTDLVDRPSGEATNVGTLKVPLMDLEGALASPRFLEELMKP